MSDAHELDVQQLREQLRESEQRFLMIAEAVPQPLAIVRLEDGMILYGNRRIAEHFQTDLNQIVGHRSLDFYSDPSDRERLTDLLAKDGFVRDFQLEGKKTDGSRVWLSVSLQPITFDGQECALACMYDLTEQKRAERALLTERQLLKQLLDLNERERQLFAYELHDGLVQDLTASLFFLEAACRHFSEENEDSDASLLNAAKLLRQALAEARRLMNRLRLPILEESGVVAAIRSLTEEVSTTTGLDVQFDHDVQFDRLAPTLEMAIYRVVQEGLNNVWQHSKSARAKVRLNQCGDEVAITVRDWGVGFDPEAVSGTHCGLQGVRARAKLLGGDALVESAPGEGTCLTAVFPLSDVLLHPVPSDPAKSVPHVRRAPRG